MLAVSACALLLCGAAHALQRVNLTTGFSYDCTHSEPVDSAHMRLFLYVPGGEPDANFVVIASHQIASVETIPDPEPPAQPMPAAALPAAAVRDLPHLLAHAGEQHNIDVDLLASIVNTESGGRTHAVSRTGARGLMQLMPQTAHDLGVADAFQPDQNIAGGTAYLDALLNRYDPLGDKHGLDLALAAYNAGPAAVDRYHGIPPYRETRAYVARVEREFIRRKAAAAHSSSVASVAH